VGPKTPALAGRRPLSSETANNNNRNVNRDLVSVPSQTRPVSRPHSRDRIDPASMPVAGKSTLASQQRIFNDNDAREEHTDEVQVRRTIVQPVIPTADDIPKNRIFLQNTGKHIHHRDS
jgi:hypothetical protein